MKNTTKKTFKQTLTLILTGAALLSSCGGGPSFSLYPSVPPMTPVPQYEPDSYPYDYGKDVNKAPTPRPQRETVELEPQFKTALQEQMLSLLLLNSDRDQDQQLNINEFDFGLLPTRLFAHIDDDEDGQIQQQELWEYQEKLNRQSGSSRSDLPLIFPDAVSLSQHLDGAFLRVDQDQDQLLSQPEVLNALAQVAIYHGGDAEAWNDNRLSPLSRRLMNYADANEDNHLQREELGTSLWNIFE